MRFHTGPKALAAALITLVLGGAATALAQVRLPSTPADHLALAKTYQEKAAAYRKEVQLHREMSEAYKKSGLPPDKSGKPNPWVKKMEDHCKAIADTAEKMAVEADKAAEYHTLRAKELQGK